jgi:hypothetical protein
MRQFPSSQIEHVKIVVVGGQQNCSASGSVLLANADTRHRQKVG